MLPGQVVQLFEDEIDVDVGGEESLYGEFEEEVGLEEGDYEFDDDELLDADLYTDDWYESESEFDSWYEE